MDKESSQESLAAPTPAAGKKKRSADGVLGVLKIGNILLSLIYILLAVVLVLYFGYIRYDNKAAKERADDLTLAKNLLKTAYESLSDRYMGKMEAAFGAFFRKIRHAAITLCSCCSLLL